MIDNNCNRHKHEEIDLAVWRLLLYDLSVSEQSKYISEEYIHLLRHMIYRRNDTTYM